MAVWTVQTCCIHESLSRNAMLIGHICYRFSTLWVDTNHDKLILWWRISSCWWYRLVMTGRPWFIRCRAVTGNHCCSSIRIHTLHWSTPRTPSRNRSCWRTSCTASSLLRQPWSRSVRSSAGNFYLKNWPFWAGPAVTHIPVLWSWASDFPPRFTIELNMHDLH